MKAKRAATWAALAVVTVGGFEGMRRTAYRDPVGIPTVCFGETRDVKLGDAYTSEQCKAMFTVRLEEFAAGVDKCLHVETSDKRYVAIVSFAYNVGTGAFCKSGFARKLNAQDPSACDELLKWTTARGVTLPGLVRRRQEERALCLQ